MAVDVTEGLKTGWTWGLNVRRAIELLPRDGPIAFALLSWIDSTPATELTDLPPLLREWDAPRYRHLGGVAVELETLLRLVGSGKYFHGFDEIWLFEEVPRGKSPPPRICSVDEVFAVPADLAEWMRSAQCTAGLGDGYGGLNYATSNPRLAALWSA